LIDYSGIIGFIRPINIINAIDIPSAPIRPSC